MALLSALPSAQSPRLGDSCIPPPPPLPLGFQLDKFRTSNYLNTNTSKMIPFSWQQMTLLSSTAFSQHSRPGWVELQLLLWDSSKTSVFKRFQFFKWKGNPRQSFQLIVRWKYTPAIGIFPMSKVSFTGLCSTLLENEIAFIRCDSIS